MDKITIAASAAICGTIVVAVLVFAAASRRRSRTVHRLHTQLPDKLPNPCCGGLTGTPSPSGPLSSLATLGAFGKQREWDQVSAYSARSIPRARTYTDPAPADPLPGRPGRARSLADGQSQHSYSQSGRYGVPGYPGSLLGSRAGESLVLRFSHSPFRFSLSGASVPTTGYSFPTHSLRPSAISSISGCGVRARIAPVSKRRGGWRYRWHGGIAPAAAVAVAPRQQIQRGLPWNGVLRHLGQLDRPRHGHLHGAESDDARRIGPVIACERGGATQHGCEREGRGEAGRALLAGAERRGMHFMLHA